jgi:ankyrin repeat protein
MSDKLLTTCQAGDLSAVQELLHSGVDPNLPGEDGSKALVLAAVQGSGGVVRALLDAGVAPDTDQRGITALVAASRNGHL